MNKHKNDLAKKSFDSELLKIKVMNFFKKALYPRKAGQKCNVKIRPISEFSYFGAPPCKKYRTNGPHTPKSCTV